MATSGNAWLADPSGLTVTVFEPRVRHQVGIWLVLYHRLSLILLAINWWVVNLHSESEHSFCWRKSQTPIKLANPGSADSFTIMHCIETIWRPPPVQELPLFPAISVRWGAGRPGHRRFWPKAKACSNGFKVILVVPAVKYLFKLFHQSLDVASPVTTVRGNCWAQATKKQNESKEVPQPWKENSLCSCTVKCNFGEV